MRGHDNSLERAMFLKKHGWRMLACWSTGFYGLSLHDLKLFHNRVLRCTRATTREPESIRTTVDTRASLAGHCPCTCLDEQLWLPNVPGHWNVLCTSMEMKARPIDGSECHERFFG